MVCNVTDNDAVKAAVAQCVAKFGKIDCVVCSAGIGAVNAGYKLDAEDEQFWQNMDAVIDICQTGVWRVVKASLPHLTAPGGRIVNIASVAGIRGGSLTAYHTAKVIRLQSIVALACFDHQLLLSGSCVWYRANAGKPARASRHHGQYDLVGVLVFECL